MLDWYKHQFFVLVSDKILEVGTLQNVRDGVFVQYDELSGMWSEAKVGFLQSDLVGLYKNGYVYL